MTSRNASSNDSGWTSGVTWRKTSITELETVENSRKSGAITIASGQTRRARVIGIAEWTPLRRAG